MAVMVQAAAVTSEARVATSAVRTYAARHERVSEVPLSQVLDGAVAGDVNGVRAVVAGDLRVVEIVLPEEMEPGSLAPAIWLLAARGWTIDILTPSHRLGEAHAALRGSPCLLQPWWIDGGEVSFGSFETP